MNRDQGIQWGGDTYIQGMVGGSKTFTELDIAFRENEELLANAHFEFPSMQRNGFVSPSGWQVKLFPSMMAKVNHTNVAGIVIGETSFAEQSVGISTM